VQASYSSTMEIKQESGAWAGYVPDLDAAVTQLPLPPRTRAGCGKCNDVVSHNPIDSIIRTPSDLITLT